MIMKENDFLVEAKADLDRFNQWIKDGLQEVYPNSILMDKSKSEFANKYANKFVELKSRIKSPFNDFYYWMKNSTVKDFLKYVSDLDSEIKNKKITQQKEKDGAELIYSDDTWKVYHITNYEASAKYGKGTKWCITGTERWNDGNSGKDTFKQYHEKNHVEFYFFIKNGTEKYAVALYPDGETTEIFNAEDVSIAYIPDAPHIEDFPDVSTKDEKKLLINAIASGKIDEGILLGAMQEIGNDNDSHDLFITTNPNVASSVLDEKIPDGYLEFEAVYDGRLSKEEYENITGEELTDEEIEYGWGGDLPEITVSDKYATKAEACNVENFKKHKYWIFFTDYDFWDNSDLVYADDLVGLFNNVYQMLDFQSMYEFVEAIADTILYQIKLGKLDREAIKDIGISDEYLGSLSESYHLSESIETDYASIVKMALENINAFLDEYGFEVELIDDYDFDSNALGMFLNSIQDNASVFPIALNKDAIISGSKNYEVDLDTAILTTIAHEVGHGIFNYLEDFYDLDRSEEEDIVEEFARNYYDNNLANDTLYKMLQDYMVEDKDVVVESLVEMRGKGNISDTKILKYFDECVEELKKINFTDRDDCFDFTDIDLEEGDTVHTFGTMALPKGGQGNFKLILNRHMFNEPEEAIKNTILHELCHYITDKLAIDCNAFYSKNGNWYINTRDIWNAKDYKGHGKVWKYIASKVESATGQHITRTNDYEMHTGVGSHANDSYKYIVKCKHCGNEFKYMKRTKFVDAVIAGNGHVENWWCNCSDGTKGHDFEIVRGN